MSVNFSMIETLHLRISFEISMLLALLFVEAYCAKYYGQQYSNRWTYRHHQNTYHKSSLIPVMAWRRSGAKPWLEPMLTNNDLPIHWSSAPVKYLQMWCYPGQGWNGCFLVPDYCCSPRPQSCEFGCCRHFDEHGCGRVWLSSHETAWFLVAQALHWR